MVVYVQERLWSCSTIDCVWTLKQSFVCLSNRKVSLLLFVIVVLYFDNTIEVIPYRSSSKLVHGFSLLLILLSCPVYLMDMTKIKSHMMTTMTTNLSLTFFAQFFSRDDVCNHTDKVILANNKFLSIDLPETSVTSESEREGTQTKICVCVVQSPINLLSIKQQTMKFVTRTDPE